MDIAPFLTQPRLLMVCLEDLEGTWKSGEPDGLPMSNVDLRRYRFRGLVGAVHKPG